MIVGAGTISWDLWEATLGHDTGASVLYSVGKWWFDDLQKENRATYNR